MEENVNTGEKSDRWKLRLVVKRRQLILYLGYFHPTSFHHYQLLLYATNENFQFSPFFYDGRQLPQKEITHLFIFSSIYRERGVVLGKANFLSKSAQHIAEKAN